MKALACLVGAALALWNVEAFAESRRMALVIGVNRGSPEDGLPDLQRAESDAMNIAASLMRYGGVTQDRLIVLTGPMVTREAILEAARKLGEANGGASNDAAFSLFYTGHGIGGGLFTARPDEFLDADFIATVLETPGAGLRIAFFDACFSGSLAPGVGRTVPKGAQPIPWNPFTELPDLAVGGQGQIIISSSRAGEISYEDPVRGGLFTYFFIEALTHAAPGQAAVDLDTLVTYAIQHTRAEAERLGRTQVPEVVELTKRSDPIFYAFPGAPDAQVLLGAGISGCVLVRHTNSQLEARLDPLAHRAVAIRSGTVDIESCAPRSSLAPIRGLSVAPGDTIEVAATSAPSRLRSWPGFVVDAVQARGGHDDIQMEVRHPDADLTLHGAIGYRHSLMLAPEAVGDHGLRTVHELQVGAWAHHDMWGWGLLTAAGGGEQQFEGWGYTAWSLDFRGAVSAAMPLGAIALRLDGSAGARRTAIAFTDGAEQTRWDPAFGASIGLVVPIGGTRPVGYAVTDIGTDLLRVGVSDLNDGWEIIPVVALRIMTGHW